MKETSLNIIRKSILLSLIAFMTFSNGAEGMHRAKRGAEVPDESVVQAEEKSGQKATSPVRKRGKRAVTAASTVEENAGEPTASTSSSIPSSTALDLIRNPRFARATLSIAFKHMLLDDDRESLISFLTAFTSIPIKSVNFSPVVASTLKTQLDRELEEKREFPNLTCRDNKGRYFLIKIQMKEQGYGASQALSDVARIYSQQLEDGRSSVFVAPVVALNILGTDSDTLPEGHFKRDFQLLDRDHLKDLRDGVTMQDSTQLPYMRLIRYELPQVNLSTMPDSPLRQWLQLLKESRNLADIPDEVEDPIRKAYERLRLSTWGSQLRDDYIYEDLHLEDCQNALERAYKKGVREGRLEAARKMLAQNSTLEDIIEKTSLSAKDIEALRNADK